MPFFFFFFTQCSVGTALAELREIRGEKIQKIVEFFALILMCPWCVNECKSKCVYFFFFSWKYRMLQFCKMTVEWKRADDIAYSISFPLFLWPSKLPYVLFKSFQHFHFNPHKLGAFLFLPLHQNSTPCRPIWPVFDSTWCSACRLRRGSVLARLWCSCEAVSGDISIIPDWIC